MIVADMVLMIKAVDMVVAVAVVLVAVNPAAVYLAVAVIVARFFMVLRSWLMWCS